MTEMANALPTKGFFIDNLTRDLSLEDAILDLVDNSIDAFVRTREVDVSSALLTGSDISKKLGGRADIQLTVTPKKVVIKDFCGGIDIEHALKHVFRFGRADKVHPDEPSDAHDSTLGVYGIGLKRAIFKMGRDITIESCTPDNGFSAKLDVVAWSKTDDWSIPLTPAAPASNRQNAGTVITVKNLTDEVALRVRDGTLLKRLANFLGTTYSLFIEKHISISLNDVPVEAIPLPLAASDDVAPAFEKIESPPVEVDIMAGLAARYDGEWLAEKAGWYVLCNGRVVVSADKTDLTGWGLGAPQYHSKYRGFVGIAFFFSKKPSKLPWTTTKRGLNRESAIFQEARSKMSAVARPVLSFINDMYPSEPGEAAHQRKLADELKAVSVATVVRSGTTTFKTAPKVRGKKSTVSIQFEANRAAVDRIKRKLNKPNWGANRVGRHAFEHYLKVECPE
jgi:hypothetical protein